MAGGILVRMAQNDVCVRSPQQVDFRGGRVINRRYKTKLRQNKDAPKLSSNSRTTTVVCLQFTDRSHEPPSTTMTGIRRGRRDVLTSASGAASPPRSRRLFRDAPGVCTSLLVGPLDAPATGVVGPFLCSGGPSVRTAPVVAETQAVSMCSGSCLSCSRNPSSRTMS